MPTAHLFALADDGLAVLHGLWSMGPAGHGDVDLRRGDPGGQPIKLFNHGNMRRDFTYVDDVVESIVRLVDRAGGPRCRLVECDRPIQDRSAAPWRIYNIGNNNPVEIVCRSFELLEQAIGKKAIRELLPMQPGDVPATYADVDDLMRDVDFRPSTPIEEGVARFIAWYRGYHGYNASAH